MQALKWRNKWILSALKQAGGVGTHCFLHDLLPALWSQRPPPCSSIGQAYSHLKTTIFGGSLPGTVFPQLFSLLFHWFTFYPNAPCLENVMVRSSWLSLFRMAISVPFFLYSMYCNLVLLSVLSLEHQLHLSMPCFVHYFITCA